MGRTEKKYIRKTHRNGIGSGIERYVRSVQS